MSQDVYRALVAQLEADHRCATATIVSSSGSIPNEVGAIMLVDSKGELLAGTIGGGAIEHQALEQCKEAIAEGEHRKFTYHLTEEEAGGIGMMCGGTAHIFVQVHKPRCQLVLVGGGHINLELAHFAERFDFSVTVIDDREEWCTEAQYPRARRLLLQPAEAFERVNFSQETYVVVATRDRDTPALKALVGRTVRYIGVVASKRKALRILQTLERDGVDTRPLLDVLHAPTGLDIGGRSPADVALSILAEIQAVRHGKALDNLTVTREQMLQYSQKKGA